METIGIEGIYILCITGGVLINGTPPLFFELSVDVVFPIAEGLTTTLLTLLNNIAGFYREELSYNKAIDYYKQALLVNPNNAYIYNNLAKIYFDLNDHQEAKKNSFKALEMKNNDGDIQKTISFICLKDHDFENGWNYFDGRLDLEDFREKNNYVKKINNKIYRSSTLNNKRGKFLIVREQGVGDEILYGSMYGDLLKKVENVTIECDPRLLNLFKRSFPKYSNSFVELGSISNHDYEIEKIDYVLYAGSLGRYYRKRLENFINEPFLKIDQKKYTEIQSKLSQYDNKYNIGISWKSFNNRYASDKSLELDDFKDVFKLPDCNVFNLQYGDVLDEINNFNDKKILVTGGTGTFGKKFVEHLLKHHFPKRLVIFSRDEQKQYFMSQEFSEKKYKCLRYFLGDVRDRNRLEMAFKNIDIVVHSAAMKHVPAAEYNPNECIATNIIGAQNVIDAAINNRIKKVLALSTDKAAK